MLAEAERLLTLPMLDDTAAETLKVMAIVRPVVDGIHAHLAGLADPPAWETELARMLVHANSIIRVDIRSLRHDVRVHRPYDFKQARKPDDFTLTTKATCKALRIFCDQLSPKVHDLATVALIEGAGASASAGPASGRDCVFISCSRADEKWLKDFTEMLAPVSSNKMMQVWHEAVQVWHDKKIKPGKEWRKEIDDALGRARVGLCLVTGKFLASDFIRKVELPYLLDAAKQQTCTFIWVAVDDCLWEETPLKDVQAANELARPLSTLTVAVRKTAIKEVCKKVIAAYRERCPPSA